MILAIETSSPRASLALWDQENQQLIHEEVFSTNRAHNAVIFGYTESLLEKCDRKLDCIAVGLGPGSYSGVRVGIALANGLGLSMAVETLGISSLLAYSSERENYAVIGDARRKTRFLAQIIAGQLAGDPELIPEEDFSARLSRLRTEEKIDTIYTPDKNVAEEVPTAILSQPTAREIARIADQAKDENGITSVRIEPHYLRPPYITTPKPRRIV